jgi:hypothetical protein
LRRIFPIARRERLTHVNRIVRARDVIAVITVRPYPTVVVPGGCDSCIHGKRVLGIFGEPSLLTDVGTIAIIIG